MTTRDDLEDANLDDLGGTEIKPRAFTKEGPVTFLNGKPHAIDAEFLEKYENRKYKCDCTPRKQLKLIFSSDSQKCFFVCRGEKKRGFRGLYMDNCEYCRPFENVFNGYLDESNKDDQVMLQYA